MKASIDQDDFAPDPPALSREVDDLAARVYALRSDLNNAAIGEDVAYYGSCALHNLHQNALPNRTVRISTAERDDLLRTLAITAPRIAALVSEDRPRFLAEIGCVAAARMIAYWALSTEERVRVTTGWRADMIGRVRWLRNELHNRSILAEIEARRSWRVSEIKRQAAAFVHM